MQGRAGDTWEADWGTRRYGVWVVAAAAANPVGLYLESLAPASDKDSFLETLGKGNMLALVRGPKVTFCSLYLQFSLGKRRGARGQKGLAEVSVGTSCGL